jgi:hypothetical protein
MALLDKFCYRLRIEIGEMARPEGVAQSKGINTVDWLADPKPATEVRQSRSDLSSVQQLEADELHAYFKPCLDALEFDCAPLNIPHRKFPAPPNHLVYFIRGAGGAIKIGFTQQPLKGRLKCIQNGSPVRLEVLAVRPASQECERAYHRRYARHRLHGEWFKPHPDILAEIDRLQLLYYREN